MMSDNNKKMTSGWWWWEWWCLNKDDNENKEYNRWNDKVMTVLGIDSYAIDWDDYENYDDNDSDDNYTNDKQKWYLRYWLCFQSIQAIAATDGQHSHDDEE